MSHVAVQKRPCRGPGHLPDLLKLCYCRVEMALNAGAIRTEGSVPIWARFFFRLGGGDAIRLVIGGSSCASSPVLAADARDPHLARYR